MLVPLESKRREMAVGTKRSDFCMTLVTSPSMKYLQEEVWFPCSLDVLGWDDKFHELMLNDSLRMTAYEAAIKRAVRPGDLVLDLGTGTGILAQWALEAGAERVFGIEVNDRILALATERIRTCGFENRFEPVHALSYDARLPQPVDIIISETIGNFGDNEDCHHILTDARTRFLKPGGRMLPERLTTFFVPVSSPKAHAQIEEGKCKAISEVHALDKLLSRLEIDDPFAVYYDVVLPESAYLSSPRRARRFDFTTGKSEPTYRVVVRFPVTTDGLLTGFKGYFIAHLAEGVIVDISGWDIDRRKASDSWKHSYLPIRKPIEVRRGQTITLTLERLLQANRASPFSFRYQWHAQVGNRAAFRASPSGPAIATR